MSTTQIPPGTIRYPIFNYLTLTHGITLTETEIDDLIDAVDRLRPQIAAPSVTEPDEETALDRGLKKLKEVQEGIKSLSGQMSDIDDQLDSYCYYLTADSFKKLEGWPGEKVGELHLFSTRCPRHPAFDAENASIKIAYDFDYIFNCWGAVAVAWPESRSRLEKWKAEFQRLIGVIDKNLDPNLKPKATAVTQ